ncbi:hypothetical protein ACFYUK_33085 [Nonomuraea wenchangensis]
MTTPAAAAAVTVARQHGIRVEEPVLLHDSFNLRVHLRPAPVVARVPTVTAMGRERPDEVLRRELEVVSHLHRAGAGWPGGCPGTVGRPCTATRIPATCWPRRTGCSGTTSRSA